MHCDPLIAKMFVQNLYLEPGKGFFFFQSACFDQFSMYVGLNFIMYFYFFKCISFRGVRKIHNSFSVRFGFSLRSVLSKSFLSIRFEFSSIIF
jgi:hypothetical protein